MTVYFTSTFEVGNLTEWDGTNLSNGTFAATGSIAHTGTWSGQSDTTATNGTTGEVYKDLAGNKTELYFRAYFRITILPNAGKDALGLIVFRDMDDFADRAQLFVKWEGTHCHVYVNGTGGVLTAGTTIITTNTWYCFELYCKLGDGTGILTAWVDGVQDSTQTSLANNHTIARVRVGGSENDYVGAFATTINIDDCICADSYIGPMVLGGATKASPKRSLMGVGRAIKTPIYNPRSLEFPKFNPKVIGI